MSSHFQLRGGTQTHRSNTEPNNNASEDAWSALARFVSSRHPRSTSFRPISCDRPRFATIGAPCIHFRATFRNDPSSKQSSVGIGTPDGGDTCTHVDEIPRIEKLATLKRRRRPTNRRLNVDNKCRQTAYKLPLRARPVMLKRRHMSTTCRLAVGESPWGGGASKVGTTDD